jgi:hypothetical protein
MASVDSLSHQFDPDPPELRLCLMCGSVLRKRPDPRRPGKFKDLPQTKRFCSPECRQRHRRFRKSGKRPGQKWAVCKNCPTRFRRKRRDQIFCSKDCLREYHRHGFPNFQKFMKQFWRHTTPILERQYATSEDLQKLRDELVQIERKLQEEIDAWKMTQNASSTSG